MQSLKALESKVFHLERMVGEMQILPAIDIKDGQAVRLFKGDFNVRVRDDRGVDIVHVQLVNA